MGIGLVDPILPALASQLDASPSQVELLFTSYFAFTGVSMLVTGPALRERRDRVVPGRQARRGRLPRGPVPRRRRGGAAGAGDPARRAPPPRRGGVRAGARTAPARDRRGAGRRDRARATRGLSLAARARTGGHRGREGRPFPHSTAHRSNHCAKSVAQLTASAQSIRARHRVCGNRRFRSTPSGRKPPPERNPPGRTHPPHPAAVRAQQAAPQSRCYVSIAARAARGRRGPAPPTSHESLSLDTRRGWPGASPRCAPAA